MPEVTNKGVQKLEMTKEVGGAQGVIVHVFFPKL